MQTQQKEGLVTRVTGSEVWVEVEGGVVRCQLRGRFRIKKKGFRIAAGDCVRVGLSPRDGEAGTVENVEKRDSYLARYIEREAAERIIVANVEMLFVVATLASPPLRHDFVDRVLVAAEWGHVRSSVVLNKIDLSPQREIDDFAGVYESCGYPVITSSALTGEGVERLSGRLDRGVYAFVGESGVGKSSLLMKIDPGLDLKVRAIGDKSGRGRHTTTYSQLFKFGAGYLADTPGIQTFGFPGNDKFGLRDCFPEFEAHADGCRFSPCTHSHEPECGVKNALDSGSIKPSRYQSYLKILAEVEEREKKNPW